MISTSGHSPAKCRIYNGQNMDRSNLVWAYPQPEPNPYQLEWDHLIDAIRNDKIHNEVERGVKASLVTSMGRMACHTGRTVTWDKIVNFDHEFAPEVDKLASADSPAPLQMVEWQVPGADAGHQHQARVLSFRAQLVLR